MTSKHTGYLADCIVLKHEREFQFFTPNLGPVLRLKWRPRMLKWWIGGQLELETDVMSLYLPLRGVIFASNLDESN